MSRVFRALEKAEKEKRESQKSEPSLRVYREKDLPRKEEQVIKFPEEKVERLELPPREQVSVLIPPSGSFAAEEFRKLKTHIFMRFPNPPCTLLVTSAAPREGKTTVAVNLAFAISRELNRKAILVDGDLRNPSIHPKNFRGGKGLSDYLAGNGATEEVCHQSESEKLVIVPAGSPSPRAAELIGSKRMGELLSSLSSHVNETYVIIDSPPLIATSEPIMLSKEVDGVILVILANKTPKDSIKRAFKLIDQSKVVGVVFNQVDVKQSGYYSKYYYKYYSK